MRDDTKNGCVADYVCMRLCKLSCDVTIFCCSCVHSLFPINFNHHHYHDHHHHRRRHRCRHHHHYHHHRHHHRRRRRRRHRRFRCHRRHHYHCHCHHRHHRHHHHHHHHHHRELKLMLSEMVWKLQVNLHQLHQLHQLFGCFGWNYCGVAFVFWYEYCCITSFGSRTRPHHQETTLLNTSTA